MLVAFSRLCQSPLLDNWNCGCRLSSAIQGGTPPLSAPGAEFKLCCRPAAESQRRGGVRLCAAG
jgi:hypothetical protein